MEFAKKILPYLIIFGLSLVLVWPLSYKGYFPMHDDTQPTRVYEMARALEDGQFPVRWVSDLGYGYGYPIFNFYSPLPYYIGAGFYLSGLDILNSTKAMMAMGVLLSGLGLYLMSRRWWGVAGGILSAVLYQYAPYHAIQLYVRGAVGELYAYAFMPFFLWGASEAGRGKRSGIIWGGLALAGLILSHNITAVIVGYFIAAGLLYGAYIGISERRYGMLRGILALVFLGLGLSAFFWLPAITEARYTKVAELTQGTNDYRRHFVFADQLWDSSWGFAGSAPGREDGMSFKLGKIHVILGLLGVAALMLVAHDKKRPRKMATIILTGLGVSVFMMLVQSEKIWSSLPFMSFVQYPWRFLAFTLLFLSFAGGALLYIVGSKFPSYKLLVTVITVFSVLLFNTRYFQPQRLYQVADGFFTDVKRIKWNISRISHEYLAKDFPVPREDEIRGEKIAISDAIMVEQREERMHFAKYVISAEKEAEIVFSIAYFPGWKFFVDATQVVPELINGKPMIFIPSGKHIVTAYFGNTRVRQLGNSLTLLTLLVAGYLLVEGRKVTHREKHEKD